VLPQPDWTAAAIVDHIPALICGSGRGALLVPTCGHLPRLARNLMDQVMHTACAPGDMIEARLNRPGS